MALPTKGRVIVDTTVGEIDIELWSKETPKACRNFLALAMEGYYDGVIFHRYVSVPGVFGESLIRTSGSSQTSWCRLEIEPERVQEEKPFEDEIHPRLRFAHRGIVAMANNGTKNSNDSQFFITLDRADELHGKHTLFGRVIGDTIFNVLKIGGMEIDENERPLYPPKIKTIRILDNPFPDIIPRITAEEKRAQQKAREQALREREEEQRRRGAKKDVKLLSFGADEGGEEEEPVVFKKKPIARPDLVENPDLQQAIPGNAPPKTKARSTKTKQASATEKDGITSTSTTDKPVKKKDAVDISTIRAKHAEEQAAQSTTRQTEIAKMEAEIRKLSRRTGGGGDSDEDRPIKKVKKSYLEEEMAKYNKGRGANKKGKRKDEGDVLAALGTFRSMLQRTAVVPEDEDIEMKDAEEKADSEETPKPSTLEEDPGIEVDDDIGFLSHALRFPKDNSEEVNKAERDYEVIDPRQRSARAREEERIRKKAHRPKDGGRGYRR
ncbi:hypothetical protein NLI96_g740 [Meripilus lineatus]|uniref:PPIase cyclophilin-type domain-containing protein n=1 Tax=Meripilus lineatus TaxID=2056292 RepID=A0AAD5VG17_9APHY|nr:hypothetical protein NLI96_g740 [Physisporinus lineatus]